MGDDTALPLPPPLVDTDVFLVVRQLTALKKLTDAAARRPLSHPVFLLAGHVARNELSTVQNLVSDLEAAGILRVCSVTAGTAAATLRRTLIKAGIDKGEAEAVAWALTFAPSTRFFSNDARARREAASRGLPTGDALDLVIAWSDASLITSAEIVECLGPWEDDPHAFGRPRDFTTVAESLAIRRDHRGTGRGSPG